MYKLTIHIDAKNDLLEMSRLNAKERTYAARIATLLQEVKDTPELLRELATHDFSTDDIEVGKYLQFWNNGVDLWKIKMFDFDSLHNKWNSIPYRVLYAYDMECHTFRVLGVVHRSFNYDANHELTKRILSTYDSLGLPKHKILRHTNNRRH
jgi:hypothetical protein